jgi:predicted permease
MSGWILDLTHAIRLFRKAKSFTFLAVLCLGLGIGVNASIFSVLNSLFFRPLPVHQPDQLVVLSRGGNPLISYPVYRDLSERSQSLEGVAASNPTESSIEFDNNVQTAGAEAVSLSYPTVVGVHTVIGRWFESEDELAAVISYRTWQRVFHGDPAVLGKRIRSETQWYTVVGVAPKEFEGIYLPMSMDLWVPLRAWTKQYPNMAARMEDRARPFVFVFGRIKAGASLQQSAADVNRVDIEARPDQTQPDKNMQPLLVERVRGVPSVASRRAAGPIAAVLMVVVGIVLLIACVNVGNLLLARGAAREAEISLRMALGAGRGRIARQLLTESLLLAVMGGVAGLVFGMWTSRLLEALLALGPYESVRLDMSSDLRVIGFTAGLSLLTVLLFGLSPAWRASRMDMFSSIKGAASQGLRFGLRRVSLVAQVALSLLLLLTAGLFLGVLVNFEQADPGFALDHRLYVTVLASPPEFTPESGQQFYAQTLNRLRAIPGVRNAAVTNVLPLTPINASCAAEPGGGQFPATSSVVGPEYLATMRIPLLSGRDFSQVDSPNGPAAAIVSETLARRVWPNQSAIGKRIMLGCHETVALEVVGVARDAKFASLGEPAKPHIYRAFAQDYGGVQNILVETASDPGPMLETVRKAIVKSNSGVRIFGSRTLKEWVDQSYWQIRWEVSVLGGFAALALLLATVGLYGVIAYQVTLRTREIGIRLAVGARPADVSRMILRQGLQLTLIGIGIGLVVSFGVTRTMARLLYGVSPTDPTTYAIVSLLWLAVAGIACYAPARRAAAVDPMAALRNE